MARKRKHGSKHTTDTTPQKKRKTSDQPPQQHPHGSFDPEQEYEAEAIVDENKSKYLIRWADNPVTGEKYSDSWEPKAFANRELVRSWHEVRRGQASAARATPKNKESRARKTLVVSSSPPFGSSSSPARSSPAEQQQQQRRDEDDLEIGESQPTVDGAAESDVEAGSPLFVPLDSPKSRSGKGKPAVQVSDPPSSYVAGEYLQFSSSQVPESAAPVRRTSRSPVRTQGSIDQQQQQQQSSPGVLLGGQTEGPAREQPSGAEQRSSPAVPTSPVQLEQRLREKSPEASQWQPTTEGDDSRTTENTTEVSAAASASEPANSSAPAVSEQTRADNIVTDSQSQPDSSSFVPTSTQTQSSSAPEPRGRGRPPKEVTQVALTQRSEATQSSISQAEESTQSSAPQDTSTAALPSQENTEAQGEASQLSVVEAATASGQPAPYIVSQAASESQTSAAVPKATQEERRSLEGDRSPPTDSQTESHSIGRTGDSQPEAGPSGTSEVLQDQPASSAQPDQVADGASADVRESTERAEAAHVDLTNDTQQAVGQTSSISITPLPPRFLAGAQRASKVLQSQDWPSSDFPFQTQVSGPSITNGTSTQQPPSRRIQNQASPKSALGHPFDPSTSAFSSQLRTSSPIPSGPKHSLATFDVHQQGAPARPQTPSSPLVSPSRQSAMEATPGSSSSSSAKERLQAMRAQHRAQREADSAARRAARANSRTPASAPSAASPSQPKSSVPAHMTADASVSPKPALLASPLAVERDVRRSPSVVPATEALPEITRQEMNTSERYPTLLPQASIGEGEEGQQRRESATGRPQPPQPSPRQQTPVAPPTANAEASDPVYTIPITLVGHQRDQYPETVYYHQDLIQEFLGTSEPDEQLVRRAETFVERMRAITLHPDLDNEETFTQYDVEPEQQAGWDVSCSAKFRFLKGLLDGLRDVEMRVVVACGEGGRILEILSTFLKGIGIRTEAASSTDSPDLAEASKLRVTVATSDDIVKACISADLVLGLSATLENLRAPLRSLRKGKPLLVVNMIVPRSVEHVKHQLGRTLSGRARLRALVSGINQLKSEAGRREGGELNPTDAANLLVAYMKDSTEGKTWPLAGLGTLQDLNSQTESEIEPVESTDSPGHGTKRVRGDSEAQSQDTDAHKRMRIDDAAAEAEMPTTVNPQDVELTHISDSIDKPTQPPAASASDDPIKTDTERRLQALLISAQTRLDDLTADMSALQYRHEESRTFLHATERERDAFRAAAAEAVLRRTDALNKETALRTERTELKEALNDANAKLLSHAVPERAELEALRQALSAATALNGVLEKRLEQAKKQGDFFREQYQDASNSASREVAANAELQGQVAALTGKATGEQARLRQVGYDARAKQVEQENRKLKFVLRDREAGLRFRDEEIARLKEAGRGRMGTRASSVPRSPRVGGSPMGGVGGAGARSRQGSQAAGEVKGKGGGVGGSLHPLRHEA